MTLLNTLKLARSLIDTPKKWTKFASARTACGDPAAPTSGYATQFCISGALERASCNRLLYRAAVKILQIQIELNTEYDGLAAWNDAKSRRHTDVLRIFDEAIAKEKKEEEASGV